MSLLTCQSSNHVDNSNKLIGIVETGANTRPVFPDNFTDTIPQQTTFLTGKFPGSIRNIGFLDESSYNTPIVVSGNGMQQWSKVSEKCQAWLSGIGNLFPKVEFDYYHYHLNNQQEKCNEIIENIEKPFFFVKDNYSWHLGIKSAMEHLNIMSKQERMPYQELDEEKHKHVGEIIEQIKQFV